MTLVFHPRAEPDLESVDAKHLSWKQLVNYSKDEIANLPLGLGVLGDYFEIELIKDGKNLWRVSNSVPWLLNLGYRLSGVELIVEGDAGSHLGAMISGGRVIVHGDVGSYAGYRARRGEIWASGTVGRHAGAHMIAGTLIAKAIITGDEETLGFGARRGSFVFKNWSQDAGSSRSMRRKYRPTWMGLLHQPGSAFAWLDPSADWLQCRLPQASMHAELICRDV
ncbi:MAG: hypothetical protein AAF664_20865 [Planctomycetota bacterium]